MYKWARPWKMVVGLSLVVSLLASCTGGNQSELPELPENSAATIKVMYHSSELFMSEYGNTFNVKFPEIEFEVIENSEFESFVKPGDDRDKKLIEFIKSKNIDVAILQQSQYEHLSASGTLYKLDTIIQEEKYPVDDFAPGVMDFLREKGGNAIYGLSGTISSDALFYNVDLFKQQGVEVPTHKMSVEQVMDLAQRFESKSNNDKDRTYGLHTEYMLPADYVLHLGSMSNLQIVDQKAENVVMDSEAWRTLFTKYADLMKNKKVNVQDDNNYMGYGQGGFPAGKAAMSISYYWMFEEIKYAMQGGYDGKKTKPFEWNIVSLPVDPANPDESSRVRIAEIFVISIDSANKRAAWELVKFSTGQEMARIHGRTSRRMTSRVKYQQPIEGKSMEAFTILRPAKNSYTLDEVLRKNNVSKEFADTLNTKLGNALSAVKEGKKSADQAYQDLLPELQHALVEAKKKP
ncbi:ABC transporter substrate-binding protein [Paenibacillus arenosi]|uniref:Extracellular solute-binding protein n=1 Tax=Paenibacillus arenosi TaxID=2774142 RepID=A0ABR9B428_9BACL|nr:extracellular solute-binding protein [Paenibacillus arenosi]MBD8500240.1 extracellular solute-binding protein [Paenibacillus arenosi]